MDKEIKKILKPIILLVLLMVFFSILFQLLLQFEGRDEPFLRCLYMVAITVSTVGYEDLLNVKDSNLLMVFMIISILVYMVTVAYTISNFTAFLVEGRLKEYFQSRHFLKRIKKMDQHYIICGIRDVGFFSAQELHVTKRPFVVIEEDSSAIEELRRDIPSLIFLQGDATEENLLQQAGIDRAQALIASLPDDKDNIYLILAARELNKDIKIAAKYNLPKTRKKLQSAGASYLVFPHRIGGMRITSELIRPQVVSFLDRMLRSENESGIRIEDITVSPDTQFVGKTLLDFYKQTGVLVISYHNPRTGNFQYNPSPEDTIKAGMVLIFIGSPEKRIALEKMLS